MNSAPAIVETTLIDLGTLVRGEIRTVRVGIRSEAAGAVAVDPAYTHAVKPRRATFDGPTDLDFTVFTHAWTEADVEVPLTVTSTIGTETVLLKFKVRPRPAALTVLEPQIDAVFRRRAPGWAEARIRNDGDLPLALELSATDPWLTVEGPRVLSPGDTADLRITIDAQAIPDASVRHRRKGDRYAVAGVRLNGETRIEVRAWIVRTWDSRAFGLGLVAGFIPFINVLIGAALAIDRIRSGRRVEARARRGYRCWSEARESAWFLAGLVPGLASTALTFLSMV